MLEELFLILKIIFEKLKMFFITVWNQFFQQVFFHNLVLQLIKEFTQILIIQKFLQNVVEREREREFDLR